eukprot:TRINITY_DN2724_c0_g1_i1.p1 TRINITY_DN2724_c0_g1~~TRINITY_DN2724_c0_g1_i1.p1  ORF type:complete len:200 (-),score=55.09 TRINITY_DN2724_c0_g1_i1:206-805(-)
MALRRATRLILARRVRFESSAPAAQTVAEPEKFNDIFFNPDPVRRIQLSRLRLDVETLRQFGVVPKRGRGIYVESVSHQLLFSAFDHQLLQSFCQRLAEKAALLHLDCFGVVPLPTKQRRWTVLVSPHVDKEARDQFEMKIHRRLVVVRSFPGQKKTMVPHNFQDWLTLAYYHRLCHTFLRFMPGMEVAFQRKYSRIVE